MAKSILKKTMVMFIIFSMTFGNFALVGKVYATSVFQGLFGNNGENETGHKNIVFDAYFDKESENPYTTSSDVNSYDLEMKFDLNVKEIGYLKDGMVEIESQEGDLGFKISNIRKSISEESVEESSEIQENGEEVEIVVGGSDSNIQGTDEDNYQVVETQGEIEEKNSELVIDIEEVDENKLPGEEIIQDSTENEVADEADTENSRRETITETNVLDEYSDFIEKIEDNAITLKQVRADATINFSIPIEYINQRQFKNVSDIANVRFTGIYVDENGEEHDIERETQIKINWKNERKIKTEVEVTKYIDFGSGIIIQTLVKVDNRINSEIEKNTIPVKETQLEISVPDYMEKTPSNISVVANTLEATNGQKAEEITFNDDNWNYDEESKKINIYVQNNPREVVVQNDKDTMIEEEKREDRIYNIPGVDEFVVTYTYLDVDIPEENIDIFSDIKVSQTLYSDDICENEETYKYDLSNQMGNLVSIENRQETEKLTKKFMYFNYRNPVKVVKEIVTDEIINISYIDILENLKIQDYDEGFFASFIGTEGKRIDSYIDTDDIYYKRIVVSKENFDRILGNEGNIEIKDSLGNQVGFIDKDTIVTADGNIEVNLEGQRKLLFITSKPVSEGNLVIKKVRAIREVSLEEKSDYSACIDNLKDISISSKLIAKYNYVENDIEVGNINTKIEFEDVKNIPSISINKENLSTLTKNENVEIIIALNNNREDSEVYGETNIRLDIPNYITDFEITNSAISYGDGLALSSVENEESVYIRIIGKQNILNPGEISNGTNIILNANIDVDKYTPSISDAFHVEVENSIGSVGESEKEIKYSAPSGVVSINDISDYVDDGFITSVREGKKEELISIAMPARTAQMGIVVMNNYMNEISDMTILGRIPFEGVRDPITGDDMGTNISTKMLSGIEQDSENDIKFKIYYSENGEADKAIGSEKNRWVEYPDSFDNIKSYLIVPEKEGIMIDSGKVFKFSYEFEIPENIPREKNIYGTYLVEYVNHSLSGNINEKSCPDIVGLTTGIGPELDLKISTDKEILSTGEDIKLNLKIENIGKENLNNVVSFITYDNALKYKNYEVVTGENIVVENVSEEKLKVTCPNVEIVKNLEININFSTDENMDSEKNISISANAIADNIVGETSKIIENIAIKVAKLVAKEEYYGEQEEYLYEGKEYEFSVNVMNNTDSNLPNLMIDQKVPDGFEYVTSEFYYVDSDYDTKDVGKIEYRENLGIIHVDLANMEKKKNYILKFVLKTKEVSKQNTYITQEMWANIEVPGVQSIESNKIIVSIAREIVEINQVSQDSNDYVNLGDIVNYEFRIKNVGVVPTYNINFTDEIPDCMQIESLAYINDNNEIFSGDYYGNSIKLPVALEVGTEALIDIEAKAISTDGSLEKTVENKGNLTGKYESQSSNGVVKTLVASEEDLDNEPGDIDSEGVDRRNLGNSSKGRTYNISGSIWLDKDENGKMDAGEKTDHNVGNIEIYLLDADSLAIKKRQTVNNSNIYRFSSVENGNYIVVFEYDSKLYGITTYKKEGIDESVNSDAYTGNIDRDGKQINVAKTDRIEIDGNSVSNINLGLIHAMKFDLEIDMGIEKVTVQTSRGTNSTKYNFTKFVKDEISSRQLNGAKVLVEYKINVKNNGDLKGYAKKVVDYVPEGMELNSSLDKNNAWFTSSDGNIYTSILENVELNPGETKEISLILTKEMSETNTGLMDNIVEIAEDYNIYGMTDIDSSPGNKAQKEDDMSQADVIILVKTGDAFMYTSLIITSVVLLSVAAFVVYSKTRIFNRKRGV